MDNKLDRRKSRSEAYQSLFAETVCSHDMMESFRNEDSLYKRLNPFEYSEELMELEDKLKIEFWRIVNTLLTSRQQEVIKLYADGYTQMEIAKKLSVNQSSITKSLNGNVDYKNKKVVYGGTKKRLKKIIETDTKIKEILDKMSDIRNNKW